LAEVARRLRDTLSAGDLIARIGGEEFLIVMQKATPQTASAMAHKLRDAVRCTPVFMRARDIRIPVTISIGITLGSELPEGDRKTTSQLACGCPASMLIDMADKALYGAKACGRDNVTMTCPAA
jgi:two-component system cell cycle response regulator